MFESMIENTMIAVPSRERALWLMNRAQHTLRHVAHLKPVLFVRDDDSQLNVYEKYAHDYNAYLVLQESKGCFGVSQAYDMLIDMAIDQGFKYLLILDDDMYFKMRNPILGALPQFKLCTPDELFYLFNHWTQILCKEMPAMSLVPIGRRALPFLIDFTTALMWCYGFYLPHFKEHKEHRFYKGKEIEARCDVNLAMQLLRNGYSTGYFNSLLIPMEACNPGGCSTYRSIEVEHQSIDFLLNTYGNKFFTEKISKGWITKVGNDYDAYDKNMLRRSVVCHWKKALDKEKFEANHGISYERFCANKLNAYESVYSAFIELIRNGKL